MAPLLPDMCVRLLLFAVCCTGAVLVTAMTSTDVHKDQTEKSASEGGNGSIFWTVALGIIAWSVSNYVDALRLDTTMHISESSEHRGSCRVDRFTFENLSSKNAISDLWVSLGAQDLNPPKLQLCGEEPVRFKCSAFSRNTSPWTAADYSVSLRFPVIFPEDVCSIDVSVASTYPSLEYEFVQPAGPPMVQSSSAEEGMHISPSFRIIRGSEHPLDLFLIAHARDIYFWFLACTAVWWTALAFRALRKG
jgi:hypothetical protein